MRRAQPALIVSCLITGAAAMTPPAFGAPASAALVVRAAAQAATPEPAAEASAAQASPPGPQQPQPAAPQSAAPQPAGVPAPRLGPPPAALTLNDAFARAVDANYSVRAAQAARAIDAAGVAVAGQRANPEANFEYAHPETPHWAFGGVLPLDVWGKRQRRIDVANATLAVTEAQTLKTTADVRADVRRAYYQAVGAARRVEITQELVAIATRLRDAAQDRFQTGAAPQLEALQATLALSQAQNDAAAAQGELAAARADLNALLAYPSTAAPTLGDSLEEGTLPSETTLAQQALAGNAELQMLQRQVDEARARVSLAQANRRPDPTVTGTFTYDSPPDFTYGWRVGGSIAIPILTTGKPDVAVAQATVTRALADRDARAAQITGAVSAAAARAAAARQAFQRYQTEILPSSTRVESMAEESYRAGQTGLPAFLQAVQTARDIRQRALQAGLDYQLARAELERAMGVPLK